MAGAVEQLRAQNPNTVFAAAGDLIGASTFESFIQRQADDRRAQRGRSRGLRGRQPRVRPGLRRPGQPGDGAVRRRDQPRGRCRVAVPRGQRDDQGDGPTLDDTWTKDHRRRQGRLRRCGHRGPARAGLAGRHRRSTVDRHRRRDQRRRPTSSRPTAPTSWSCWSTRVRPAPTPRRGRPDSDFGKIVTGSTTNVDAIVSGHTHLAYNYSIPVQAWAGRAVTERPVVSAGPVRREPQPAAVHRRRSHGSGAWPRRQKIC